MEGEGDNVLLHTVKALEQREELLRDYEARGTLSGRAVQAEDPTTCTH